MQKLVAKMPRVSDLFTKQKLLKVASSQKGLYFGSNLQKWVPNQPPTPSALLPKRTCLGMQFGTHFWSFEREKLSEIKPPLKLKQDGIIALIACATIELDYTCHYCNAGSLVYS